MSKTLKITMWGLGLWITIAVGLVACGGQSLEKRGPSASGEGASQVAAPILESPSLGFPQVLYFETAQVDPLNTEASVAGLRDWLAAHPQRHVLVDGHTDERGSADYNLELGDRRARQVKAAIMGQGIASDRLVVTSKGEAEPVATGHDAAAWKLNRRVVVTPLP